MQIHNTYSQHSHLHLASGMLRAFVGGHCAVQPFLQLVVKLGSRLAVGELWWNQVIAVKSFLPAYFRKDVVLSWSCDFELFNLWSSDIVCTPPALLRVWSYRHLPRRVLWEVAAEEIEGGAPGELQENVNFERFQTLCHILHPPATLVEDNKEKWVDKGVDKGHVKRDLGIKDKVDCKFDFAFTSWDIDFLASFHSQLQLTRVTRKRGPQKIR